MYKIDFPKSETFALADQVRRLVVSVTSNIAEGFSKQTMKEKVHYYYQAHGSLTEVKSQLTIARDLKYLSNDDFIKIMEILGDTHRMLLGLISKTKNYLK